MTKAYADHVIDVRTLPRPQRHVLIFGRFESLGPGEAIEIVNDHDPVGLHHGFTSFYPGGFRWEYLERGPLDWHVRIAREAAGPGESEEAPQSCGCGAPDGRCG